ncbi:MAG: OmpH family outer membrane protein [Fimbriimonadaceae bacterium]|jgi:Skp family chaperone for outer membrane proteins|nr:OmpH family outer membrane protein [Fimbriimonadaceae bacterium]
MERKKLAFGGAAACLLLLGLFVGSGFQAKPEKFAMVDVNRLVSESKQGAAFRQNVQNAGRAREELVRFVDTNRIITEEQAGRLKELALKQNRTDRENQDLERLRGEIVAAARAFNTLNTKSDPTAADRAELSRMNALSNATDALLQQWSQEFNTDIERLVSEGQEALLVTARDVVKDVAQRRGATLVFPNQVVIWAADDLTEDAVKAMNAR